MKTWMFVAEVFWLFYGMNVRPESNGPTTEDRQPLENQTTHVDGTLQKWYSTNLGRPPPLPD